MAVIAGVFTAIACGSPGAHLNPAVTLGLAIRKRRPFRICFLFSRRRCWVEFWERHWSGFIFLPHWKETPDQAAKLGGVLQFSGNP